ncbi:hypothetical protein ILUMI_02883 [Ignelater luminosus]|uniref:Uncharacterized protein n=1 Tax=Ignelater luminosus TaxID=2038154 RepID=A0A8K0DFN9_IGNLU|nr:hypothetical protein ILUMI_02883 [Ignelater luminosus]
MKISMIPNNRTWYRLQVILKAIFLHLIVSSESNLVCLKCYKLISKPIAILTS